MYQSIPFPPPPNAAEKAIPEALASQPTILFLHGNAATRAFHVRVRQYSGFTSRVRANVLAIDYRGFGDSKGTPTEDGLVLDSRAAWDWLISNGARPEDIVIVGHSLGTAISSKLAVALAEEGTHFKGLALLSPFASLHTVVDTYSVFGFLPVMLPLTVVPGVAGMCLFGAHGPGANFHILQTYTSHSFLPGLIPCLSFRQVFAVDFFLHYVLTHHTQRVKVPLLILHAENDWDIPHQHSDMLFDTLLEPYLPPLQNTTVWPDEDWTEYERQTMLREKVRKTLVTRTHVQKFGVVHEFEASGRKLVLMKTITGWHEPGTIEGVQDAIRHVFSFA